MSGPKEKSPLIPGAGKTGNPGTAPVLPRPAASGSVRREAPITARPGDAPSADVHTRPTPKPAAPVGGIDDDLFAPLPDARPSTPAVRSNTPIAPQAPKLPTAIPDLDFGWELEGSAFGGQAAQEQADSGEPELEAEYSEASEQEEVEVELSAEEDPPAETAALAAEYENAYAEFSSPVELSAAAVEEPAFEESFEMEMGAEASVELETPEESDPLRQSSDDLELDLPAFNPLGAVPLSQPAAKPTAPPAKPNVATPAAPKAEAPRIAEGPVRKPTPHGLAFTGQYDVIEVAPPDPHIELQERFGLGDFSGALVIADALLLEASDDEVALHIAEECRSRLTLMYQSRIGDLDQYPVLAVAPDELKWFSLDNRAGFLLSQLDGSSTIDELLDIVNMPALEVYRTLFELLGQRVIELKPPRGRR